MKTHNGGCLWITGLSASGKTTISSLVRQGLEGRYQNIVSLDGDQMRTIFRSGNSLYDRAGRIETGMIYSRLANELVNQGMFVIVAAIALYQEIHEWNRAHIHNYFDVFLDVPLSELFQRDPKGIYKRYKRGEIANVAGLDLAVDFPKDPWLHETWEHGVSELNLSKRITDKIIETAIFSSESLNY